MKTECTGNLKSGHNRNKACFSIGKRLGKAALCVLAALFAAGCASTEFTNREILVTDKLQKPGKVVVYDFVCSQDAASGSATTGQQAQPTAEAAEAGRQLGISIATQLVQDINDLGITAEKASPGTKLEVNDLVIKGNLVSIVEGSGAKRVIVGFGSGESKLETQVEGYQVTSSGLRKLASGTVGSGGSKTPGGIVGGAVWLATSSPIGLIANGGVKAYQEASGSSRIEGRAKATAQEIADKLKEKFRNEGWLE